MRIKKRTYQHRRDFTAIYECESCGHEVEKSGYDDSFFHDTVIPTMKCDKCNQSQIDHGIRSTPQKTKYPDGMQI